MNAWANGERLWLVLPHAQDLAQASAMHMNRTTKTRPRFLVPGDGSFKWLGHESGAARGRNRVFLVMWKRGMKEQRK